MLKMRATIYSIWLAGTLAVLPMSFANADQVGHASWYAMRSRTASGEIMNPSEFTAASRTLPFGTHVLVQNLNNGRSVVVRINDRGPFSGGRIIDVSEAAASALGMIGSGTATVRISTTGRSAGGSGGASGAGGPGVLHGAMASFAGSASGQFHFASTGDSGEQPLGKQPKLQVASGRHVSHRAHVEYVAASRHRYVERHTAFNQEPKGRKRIVLARD
jgi:peptidoglycan lytic transglycosylase